MVWIVRHDVNLLASSHEISGVAFAATTPMICGATRSRRRYICQHACLVYCQQVPVHSISKRLDHKVGSEINEAGDEPDASHVCGRAASNVHSDVDDVWRGIDVLSNVQVEDFIWLLHSWDRNPTLPVIVNLLFLWFDWLAQRKVKRSEKKSLFFNFGLTWKILVLLRQNSSTTNFILTCIYFTLLLTLLANTTLTMIKRDPIEVLPASSVNWAIFLCVCCISWSRTWYTPSITSLRVDFLAYLDLVCLL